MRAEPSLTDTDVDLPGSSVPRWCLPAVVLAAVVGLVLLADSARSISATFDETTYLRVAACWWRTGDQEAITRLGSPLTFWKLQQAPVFWLLDRAGRGDLIDDPICRQAELLPLVRIGASWLWLVALGLTCWWARRLYGPRAMVLAAWLFTLSPNLLAHGALATMELPLLAAGTGVFLLFWRFLDRGLWRDFWASAALCGLAFSCKFTAVLFPPILTIVWLSRRLALGERCSYHLALAVSRSMVAFLAVMAAADFVVTGGAVLPLSHTSGGAHPSLDGRFGPRVGRLVTQAVETPIPQDLVGFATQLQHQRSGGSSYLLGERRFRGWWYYYFVALAVKVPLSVGLLLLMRGITTGRRGWSLSSRDAMILLAVAAFLTATALGSSRNYGLRYLLPLSPLAIVWVSALAEKKGLTRVIVAVGLIAQALAVASVHPNELTYFNALAGSRIGGRHVLADSNLDWGQGLKALARLQQERPALQDLTLYYFGDTDPRHHGLAGVCHVIDAGTVHPGLPVRLEAATPYVAVSASLQWGPWGPDGYFRALNGVRPVAMTDDTTIAIYRTADVPDLAR